MIHLFKKGKQTLSRYNYIDFLFRGVHGATGPPNVAMMGLAQVERIKAP